MAALDPTKIKAKFFILDLVMHAYEKIKTVACI